MAKTRKCPVCGISVKLENLPDHVSRVHPRDEVELDLSPQEEEEISAAKRPEPIRVSGAGLKWAGVVAIILVIVITLAVLYRPAAAGPGVGDQAPNFSVTTTTNELVSLEQFRGQVVLLDFMDTDCSVCRAHTPADLVPLYWHWGGTVIFLSIDVGWIGQPDTVDKILAFKKEMGADWEYALDKQNLDDLYGVKGTPTTFIVDQNGVVAYTHQGGGATEQILESVFQDLIGG